MGEFMALLILINRVWIIGLAARGTHLAVALEVVQDGRVNGPASVGPVHRHAVSANGSLWTMLQILSVLQVVRRIVPACTPQSYARSLDPAPKCDTRDFPSAKLDDV